MQGRGEKRAVFIDDKLRMSQQYNVVARKANVESAVGLQNEEVDNPVQFQVMMRLYLEHFYFVWFRAPGNEKMVKKFGIILYEEQLDELRIWLVLNLRVYSFC